MEKSQPKIHKKSYFSKKQFCTEHEILEYSSSEEEDKQEEHKICHLQKKTKWINLENGILEVI